MLCVCLQFLGYLGLVSPAVETMKIKMSKLPLVACSQWYTSLICFDSLYLLIVINGKPPRNGSVSILSRALELRASACDSFNIWLSGKHTDPAIVNVVVKSMKSVPTVWGLVPEGQGGEELDSSALTMTPGPPCPADFRFERRRGEQRRGREGRGSVRRKAGARRREGRKCLK